MKKKAYFKQVPFKDIFEKLDANFAVDLDKMETGAVGELSEEDEGIRLLTTPRDSEGNEDKSEKKFNG